MLTYEKTAHLGLQYQVQEAADYLLNVNRPAHRSLLPH